MEKDELKKRDWVGLGVSAFMTDEAGTGISSWVNEITDAIKTANESFTGIVNTYGQLQSANLGGFYAEVYHSGTFNINAVINKSPYETSVPHSNGEASVDIKTNWGQDYSSKYNKDATYSLGGQAKAAQDSDYSKYMGQERLVPSDQFSEAQKLADDKVNKEILNRPEVAERYAETGNKLTDRVKAPDGTESKPLSKTDSDKWAENAKQGDIQQITYADSVNILNHVKEIGQAAGTAALISVTIQSAPIIINGIQKVFNKDLPYTVRDLGKDMSDWVKDDGLKVGADSFIKAAISGSLCTAIKSGALQGPFTNMTPTSVAGLSVVAVESAKALWQWQKGEISGEQAASESFKAGLRTCASLTGKVIGQALIPIPVVGAVIGSLMASLLLEKGFQNIENSRSVQMLRVIDETFYNQRNVLKGMFDINADYSLLSSNYEKMIRSNIQLIGDAERQIDSNQKLLEEGKKLNTSNDSIIQRIMRRKNLLNGVDIN